MTLNVQPLNSDLEFKAQKTIKSSQASQLKETLRYVLRNSPFYNKILTKQGITNRSVNDLDDLVKLPLTSKQQLQTHNKSFFCVDRKAIAEIVSTTGTTGEAVFIALTASDLERLALNEARSFFCAGCSQQDLVHIAVTLDNLFIAGIAYYSGIIKLGAGVYRAGLHNLARQVSLIKELKPSAIITVPSFMLKLIEESQRVGLKFDQLSLKKVLFIGDSIRDKDFKLCGPGALVKQVWPLKFYSTYGNSEAAIAFCECGHACGGHEHPDLIISEIIDEDGRPLADGQIGELVLTTLGTQGMPLLRYQTGDITFKISETCKCGRSSSRLGPILGRKAQMLKYKGTKLYPRSIENAIVNLPGVKNYVIEAFTGDDFSDRIVVKIGVDCVQNDLKDKAAEQIKAAARVTPEIVLLKANEVDALITNNGQNRKPRLFIDCRNSIKVE